jgi:hypothetical protein
VPLPVAEPTTSEAGHPTEAAALVAGYSLVLPTGWRQIPIQGGTKAAIRAVVDEVLRRFSRGKSRDAMTPYRIELERRLTDMARRVRAAGGRDLYLPIEYVHGVTIAASFVVSQVTLPEPPPEVTARSGGMVAGGVAGAAAEAVVGYLTSPEGGNATAVVAGGVAAARTERVAAPDQAEELPVGSRRVDYLIPVPGQPTRWLVMAFSTIGDGDPEGDFAKLLVELFDAIMLTFRWATDD